MSDPAVLDDLLHHCHSLGLAADVGTMFRSPALRSGGKVFAFLGHADALIVKLPHDRIVELAAQGVGHQVTMGKRTMREWAEVPAGPAPELWNDLTVEAYRFVVSQIDES